jgi:hypothetical protein
VKAVLGDPQGRDARLARIQWEIDQYNQRVSLDAVIEAVRRAREANQVENLPLSPKL